MNITVLDDYQNAVRGLDAYKLVANHNVTIYNDHTKNEDVLAERLKDTEALVLIRERTPIRAPLLELPHTIAASITATTRTGVARSASARAVRSVAAR